MIEAEMSGRQNKHVFIVGSKGIPTQYGGFETFVENLTAGKKSDNIIYHVSCMNNDEKHFLYNNADCFNVRLPLQGAAGRVLHVARVLSKVEKWKKQYLDESVIVYILGCRVGPFIYFFSKRFRKIGIKICVNPDGLEWKRDKWNYLQKKILKYCEKCLVVNADLIICDSKIIEKYIIEKYARTVGKTTYIAYGADMKKSNCSDEVVEQWFNKFGLIKNKYYLIVGRFVPENNYSVMIKEFKKSKTEKPLVIIANVEKNNFYKKLEKETHFALDGRIKFVGTVYNQELLKKIRENAFAYLHGHEVGGTNPSLLEAMASTKRNLLLNVNFNKEVAKDAAYYWNKSEGNLKSMIDLIDITSESELEEKRVKAIQYISANFNWEMICKTYEKVWKSE